MFLLDINDPYFVFDKYPFNQQELKNILNTLSNRFGSSQLDYHLKGVIYDNDDYPYISFPGENKILIQLTKDAINSKYQSIYQLSHELFHFLSPDVINYEEKTLRLDEGLATYSSYLGIQTVFGAESHEVKYVLEYLEGLHNIDDKERKKYGIAFKLISKILKDFPNCIKNIRTERNNKKLPNLVSTIKKEELLKETNGNYEDYIDFLLRKYYI